MTSYEAATHQTELQTIAKRLAYLLQGRPEDGREIAIARTKIEEADLWLNLVRRNIEAREK